MQRLSAGYALALIVPWFALACGSAEEPSAIEGGGSPAPVPTGGTPGVEGSGGAALPTPDPALGEADACSGEVASETFRAAVCSCEDTNVQGYLRTRRYTPGGVDDDSELSGSVGVNRNYITNGYADVGGSFTVAGPRDIAFNGLVRAGEDLRFNPAANVAGVVEIGRDAFLAQEMRAFGRVEVARDLYAAAGAGFRGIAVVDVGGQEHTQAISVEPPCPCGAGEIIDVAALVADAEANNDNAAAGLDPDALNVAVGLVQTSLPAGRYFVNQIGGVGAVNLHISGKSALFVGGDLIATGRFRIELEPGAELDLFVRGNLTLTGAAQFGDSARPSATRVYVGGTGDVALAGYGAFTGNLYAPQANILVGGYGDISGSLFGKNILAAGFINVGYDDGVQDAGDDCPPSAGDVPRIR